MITTNRMAQLRQAHTADDGILRDVIEAKFRIDNGPEIHAVGRFSQTAVCLTTAGPPGINSQTSPGMTLSHCVKILRADYGLLITTGWHGRCRLESNVELIDVVRITGDARRRRGRKVGSAKGEAG